MTKYGKYRGTFSKDMLPKTMKKNEANVVHLQDYFAGDGTHWVCIYNNENSDKVEYITKKMNSILCGYYYIYYIEQRNEGRTADEVLLDFYDKPTEFNEKFMKFYVDIL